eukprot:COSAG06_NODE_2236_length_7275_cov_86.121656_11_plen_82_part_01
MLLENDTMVPRRFIADATGTRLRNARRHTVHSPRNAYTPPFGPESTPLTPTYRPREPNAGELKEGNTESGGEEGAHTGMPMA